DNLISRRSSHEPIAYIRGKSEFYGREFLVSPATLQPRAETETMIELMMRVLTNNTLPITIDIGTGSGAIAITMKLENPNIKVIATEINDDALIIAKQNSNKFGAKIDFYKGNLLQPAIDNNLLANNSWAILANLP